MLRSSSSFTRPGSSTRMVLKAWFDDPASVPVMFSGPMINLSTVPSAMACLNLLYGIVSIVEENSNGCR